ncbi:MAG: hypothetical protein NC429_10610 [Lachnospiraceae bacterium]|nr:hypothetical protein [Lachnospiraceae bacterium]
MSRVNGISADAITAGNRMLEMIRNGKVNEHIMTNSSLYRHEDIEHAEMIQYSDFIKSKWGYDLLQLSGNNTYE